MSAIGFAYGCMPERPAVFARYSRVMLWAAQVSIISSGHMLA